MGSCPCRWREVFLTSSWCMLLGCVCVLILSLHACHLERGATICDLLGCIPHLKVNTTQLTQNSTVITNRFWNSSICSVPMSNVVIFVLKSLTQSVCFSKSGIKKRSAYSPLIAKTCNAACFDHRLHTIGMTLHCVQLDLGLPNVPIMSVPA